MSERNATPKEYQNLMFNEIPKQPKNKWQVVTNIGNILGYITFVSGSNIYIYQPAFETTYQEWMLEQILNKVKELTDGLHS